MKIKFIYLYLCSLLVAIVFTSSALAQDSSQVDNYNKRAYANRLTNPAELITEAKKSLALAEKIKYLGGVAEANRVLGIGYYYLNQPDTALKCYLTAIQWFKQTGNEDGEAKVNNNIGNLYRESDYDLAYDYYYKAALPIAKKVNDQDLIGNIYLNLGNIYYRKNNWSTALDYSNKANVIFTKLHNTANLILCLQNIGVIYFHKRELDTALTLLLDANQRAKKIDQNFSVASINLTICGIYMAKNQYEAANKYLDEGLNYAQLVKSTKLQYDYQLTRYQLEVKRKNYKVALTVLHDIYHEDSIKIRTDVPTLIKLIKIQDEQKEAQQKSETILAQQAGDRILFWSAVVIAALLVGLVILLVNNVNRKAKTNADLTRLNEKITEQKENLNQINHHLEEIIDDRTKDLQIKNKKLADYSLHLSHQIRGPIATLKGLLNLEKDSLIEQDECIKLMNKCVSEIDDNIIDMSGMLHETNKKV